MDKRLMRWTSKRDVLFKTASGETRADPMLPVRSRRPCLVEKSTLLVAEMQGGIRSTKISCAGRQNEAFCSKKPPVKLGLVPCCPFVRDAIV